MEESQPPAGGGERRRHPSRSALDPLHGRWTIAHRDDLTGLYNRRLLSELFEEEWARVIERHPRLSLIMLDLDGFKAVNDRYGHPAGDRVLVDTAGLLRRHFREEDLIVRYGGDEFVVLAPGAGPDTAGDLASRARDAMSRFPFRDAEGEEIEAPLSFSLGVASLPADGPGPEELLAAADRRLYAEKRSRRPRRLSRPLVVGAAVAAGLAAASASLLLRWTPPPVAAPDPAATPPPPSALAAAAEASAGDSSRLAGQLLALEQTVQALRLELERERARRSERGGSDAAVRGLEEQVRALQAELEGRATPAPAAAGAAPPGGADVAPAEPGFAAAPDADAAPPGDEPPPVFERPRLLEMDKPAFPREARHLRGDPVVRVLVTVGPEGRVVSARNLPPAAGYGLDQAARRAAETARFVPGTRDGEPIRTSAVLAIRFVRR